MSFKDPYCSFLLCIQFWRWATVTSSNTRLSRSLCFVCRGILLLEVED